MVMHNASTAKARAMPANQGKSAKPNAEIPLTAVCDFAASRLRSVHHGGVSVI
jgi:hypothetical protein